MKIAIAVLWCFQAFGTAYGQGQLLFNTRNPLGGVDAPVFFSANPSRGPGPAWSAELIRIFPGGFFAPLSGSLTTFQTRGTGAAAALEKYVHPVVVTVPDAPAGTQIVLRMRAWETASGSYEDAPWGKKDQSSEFSVTLTATPNPPGDLPSSFTGFPIRLIPEPSTLALGALGSGLFLISRWKQSGKEARFTSRAQSSINGQAMHPQGLAGAVSSD